MFLTYKDTYDMRYHKCHTSLLNFLLPEFGTDVFLCVVPVLCCYTLYALYIVTCILKGKAK